MITSPNLCSRLWLFVLGKSGYSFTVTVLVLMHDCQGYISGPLYRHSIANNRIFLPHSDRKIAIWSIHSFAVYKIQSHSCFHNRNNHSRFFKSRLSHQHLTLLDNRGKLLKQWTNLFKYFLISVVVTWWFYSRWFLTVIIEHCHAMIYFGNCISIDKYE